MLHKLLLKPGSRPVTAGHTIFEEHEQTLFILVVSMATELFFGGKSESKALEISIRDVVPINMQFSKSISWSMETVKTFCNQRLAHSKRIW